MNDMTTAYASHGSPTLDVASSCGLRGSALTQSNGILILVSGFTTVLDSRSGANEDIRLGRIHRFETVDDMLRALKADE